MLRALGVGGVVAEPKLHLLVAEVTAARSRIAAAAQLATDTAREVEEMILGVRPAPPVKSPRAD